MFSWGNLTVIGVCHFKGCAFLKAACRAHYMRISSLFSPFFHELTLWRRCARVLARTALCKTFPLHAFTTQHRWVNASLQG